LSCSACRNAILTADGRYDWPIVHGSAALDGAPEILLCL
jgi:hypothetical protein